MLRGNFRKFTVIIYVDYVNKRDTPALNVSLSYCDEQNTFYLVEIWSKDPSFSYRMVVVTLEPTGKRQLMSNAIFNQQNIRKASPFSVESPQHTRTHSQRILPEAVIIYSREPIQVQ